MIKVVRYDDAPETENPHGVSARELASGEHAQVIEINLLPGESLKRHITPVDVFFYVLEGGGRVEIGEERAEISADTLVVSPKGIPHRLMNEGDAPFRFLVVKTPRPTSSTRLL
jgi:quercetin dioxygenase-like cupin family protein